MNQGGVGLYGGSFNPIHHGHLIIARAVAERLGLSRVVFIPSANPPHKSTEGLADATDRLAMARLAIGDEPGFEVSDIEIRRTGPSYTILTVEDFARQVGDGVPLCWMIGGDTLPELHTWHRAGELVDLCRIVTAGRPGFEMADLSVLEPILSVEQIQRLRADILDTPRIDISATDIRRRVAEGHSIRYLVPDPVRAYIDEHGLYRERESGDAARSRPCCGNGHDA